MQKNRRPLFFFIGQVLLTAIFFIVFSGAVFSADKQESFKPIVVTEIKHDVSLPLSVMALGSVFYPVQEKEQEPPRTLPKALGSVGIPQQKDGAIDNAPVIPLMPNPDLTFDGVNNNCSCLPPDTNGDVGPNHYVQTVNVHYRIFDKSGN